MTAIRYSVAVRCLALGSFAALSAFGCSEAADDTGGDAGSSATGGTTGATGGTGTGGSGTGGSVGGTGGTTGGTGAGGTTGGTGGSVGGAGGTTGGTGAGATGGMGASGGAAGSMATGGAAGLGTGGTAGGTTGGTGGTGGTGNTTSCTFNITPATTSSKIATVGIVEFSVDLAGMTEAVIDFGLETTYGMQAPVDLAAANHRTLLLGMKASKTYHYRITAKSPGGDCVSEDQTVMTGALATGLPEIDVETMNAEGLYGGFLLAGNYAQGSRGAPAYILDKDGDIVWWYNFNHDATGVRMSYDGKYMWVNSANVPNSKANVKRVSMDGMVEEDLSSQFTGQNHQMAILPDETVAFYAYGQSCDDIKERAPNGTVKTIINSGTAHGVSGACHVNAIEYSPEDDTLVFSDLNHDNITKVKRDGTVVWVLGGSSNDFTGMGTTWDAQHGIDVISVDRILFFNNGPGGGGANSTAIEMLLNVGAKTASRAWTYSATPALYNQIMGDVQRLDNGNTIMAYSTQGVLHEVNAQGQLLQELVWGLPGAYGYIMKRKSLYGPPPR